ncbi:hypothetical protein KA005_75025, partial [bacterium]|nr:hypothetical protein [bacterium]
MPGTTEEIKKVFGEMRSAHETLKEYVDAKIEEIRKSGNADPLTLSAIEKVNDELTELRSKYDEVLIQSQRPGTAAAGIGEAESPEQ